MKPNNAVCSEFQYQELLYLYDELADQERLRFEAHLKNCSHCQQRLKQAQEVIKQLKPADLTPSDRSVELIKAEIARRSRPLPVWPRLARWTGVAVAASVCLVILVQVLVKSPQRDLTTPEGQVVFQWENGTAELDTLSLHIRALELGWNTVSFELSGSPEDPLEEIKESIKELRSIDREG